MEGRMAATSLQTPRLPTSPSSISTQPLQGWEEPLPGATPSWAGELGEILPKAKAAVYKHLDLLVIWVIICFTMELFTLQMIHLLRKRLLLGTGCKI